MILTITPSPTVNTALSAGASSGNNTLYIGLGVAGVILLILISSTACTARANQRAQASVKLSLPQATSTTTVQTNPFNTKVPPPRQQIMIDQKGEQYIILNNTVYYLDGAGGRLLAKGWRRVRDHNDVWYVGPSGESVWTPIYHQ
jgi:hypothetical protein